MERQMLVEIIERVSEKNQIHANNLRKYINTQNEDQRRIAEDYLYHYCKFLIECLHVDIEFIVESYLMFVRDTISEEVRFMRSGKYRYKNAKEVEEKIYSNDEYMAKYMIGLALSQFFWKNHNAIFSFFRDNVHSAEGESYLEIGCGHGLFFVESIMSGKFLEYEAIDLSQASIDITSAFIKKRFTTMKSNVTISRKDVFDADFKKKYDFIAMGEILEHVEHPKALLRRVYELLSKDGRAFISTCTNSPAVDHIFLFEDLDEVREMILTSGLVVVDEIELFSRKFLLKNNSSVRDAFNYAAILRRCG